MTLKRIAQPQQSVDRMMLAAAIIASPAAPPFPNSPISKTKVSPAPAPLSARRSVTTKLLKNGPIPSSVVPSALINYLPADAVDRVFSARVAGTGTAEEARAERALDAAVEAILAAAAEEERIAQESPSPPVVPGVSRVFGFPSLDSGPILGAFREQLFTRPVNTASAYINSLAAIAAPLAANAAAGSVFAAAALAAAARPLASAAVSGSSAAAQALGVIIEPLGAAAAAGGSVAGAPPPVSVPLHKTGPSYSVSLSSVRSCAQRLTCGPTLIWIVVPACSRVNHVLSLVCSQVCRNSPKMILI